MKPSNETPRRGLVFSFNARLTISSNDTPKGGLSLFIGTKHDVQNNDVPYFNLVKNSSTSISSIANKPSSKSVLSLTIK